MNKGIKILIFLVGLHIFLLGVLLFCKIKQYHFVEIDGKRHFISLNNYEDLVKKYKSDGNFIVKEDKDNLFTFNIKDFAELSVNKDKLEVETNSSLKSYVNNITLHKDYIIWSAKTDLDEYKENIEIFNKSRSKPRDAEIVKESNWFVIKDEEDGTQIDYDALLNAMIKSLNENKYELNISDIDVYAKPKVKSDDLKSKLDELNKFKNLSISYTSGDSITSRDFFKFMSYKNGEINFDFSFLDKVINKLDKYYTTIGMERTFDTTKNGKVNISGGTYGNIMNKKAELKYLKKQIKKGKSENNRTPKLSNLASFGDGFNDLGNTYIEISIANQHIWYYKDGSLFSDSSVVTGRAGIHDTPTGVYNITEHLRNTILRGTGYATRVSYWMRLNPQGIGLHDATWRSSFGGKIYKSNGSHGCINLPLNYAKELYTNTENYIPVIIY